MKNAIQNYETKSFTANGNKWSVIIATGQFNYVSIRKETNNPFKGSGKKFEDLVSAADHYKSPEMKIELLKIETGIN